MKHTTSRMLFAYWDALRGDRAAPDRGDIQPGGMRHVLADTFMLAQEEGSGPSFRLAGTRLRALFGRDLKGESFRELWSPEGRPEADHVIRLVIGDTVGVVIGLLATNENESELPLEMLLLPLRHRGRTQARMLGALSPASIPAWAGLVPIRSIETRSLRIVQPNLDPEPDEAVFPRPSAGRRSLFVVHDGGRI
ncbi:PAS domain-containing protein [uncultured Enterovirga sp.]|uniref:PAS domain-containing protein n=1 Tax=uncultured Enterovirga sp. TaxID=2026352 RepID=UPI0035CB7AE4